MTKAGTRVPAYPRQTKEVINTSKKISNYSTKYLVVSFIFRNFALSTRDKDLRPRQRAIITYAGSKFGVTWTEIVNINNLVKQ